MTLPPSGECALKIPTDFYLIVTAYDPMIYRRKEQVIEAIDAGHAEHIEAIYHITPDENLCRDVEEDIARDVLNKIEREERTPSDELATWIDNRLGISVWQESRWRRLVAAE